MCLAVYVASSVPLPLVKWSEEKPAFYVTDLSEHESSVRGHFALPFVYYAGAHEGCGCGFLREGKEVQELAQAQENDTKLVSYLDSARRSGADIRIFSCWEGDQGLDPEIVESINVDALMAIDFVFKERALYTIS